MEKTKRCGNCGHMVAVTARFCSNCGEAQGDLRPRADTGLLPANRKLNGDRYLIVRKLAQGGQSAVYLAMDTGNGQRCAIKEMSESALTPAERVKAINDFLREANILMGLSHPGLCRVFGTFFEDNRKPFLVMEYVEGHNLEDELIGHGRPLDWQHVVAWGLRLTDVLSYLHKQDPPVIYRDLKPANVMLLPSGSIKLIDFGIARQLFPQRLRDTARLGTDGYAPLEQYSGRSEPRSDLYALGASLYHLLTGRVPEAAPLRYAGQPLTPIRALNPSVPEPLDRVIQQALRLDANERFPNAYSMRQALEWVMQVTQNAGQWRPSGPPAPGLAQSTGPTPAQPPRRTYGPAAPPPGQSPYGPPSRPRQNSAPIVNRPSHVSGGPASMMPRPSAPPRSVADEQTNDLPESKVPWGTHLGAVDGRANGQAQPPRLRLVPLRLDVGLLEANQISVRMLELSNRGGGLLNGVVETSDRCLSVEPSRLDANTTHVRVHINTAGMQPGEYRCLVKVRTNGGDQVVPVSFMVRPASSPSGDWGRSQG